MSATHHHHEEQDFLFKYIFSQDHKMISKQFMITGFLMGFIGMVMSTLFRLQLGFPGESFWIIDFLLGSWAENGVMAPDKYLSLVTMHGTNMDLFLLTAGLSGTFSKLLIPLLIGVIDMASGFWHMMSSWMFLMSSVIMLISVGVVSGPASAGLIIYPPLSALP